MTYVDGFLVAMPRKNLAAYKKMAAVGCKVWKKHGALDYKECIGNDVKNKWGPSFPDIAKAKKGDVVVFAYIVFKSRKHRDQVNAKVMKDPAMGPDAWKDKPMPFDMKKMAYGGFEVIVE